MANLQPRVRRTRRGDFELALPDVERQVLRSLPAQLRELMSTDDPAVERLFPPAYRDDPDSEAEYRAMVGGELRNRRLSSLEVMEATIDATRLDEKQLLAWLGAINDLRLVLGTRLEVTEDIYDQDVPEDDPSSLSLALFFYLGWLEEQVVQALAAG